MQEVLMRHEEMHTRHAGRIVWFNRAKGYGILACDHESDVFFDARHVPNAKRKSIRAGSSVWFEIVEGETGPEAKAVSLHCVEPAVR
jgi:cold shock CspA family protein